MKRLLQATNICLTLCLAATAGWYRMRLARAERSLSAERASLRIERANSRELLGGMCNARTVIEADLREIHQQRQDWQLCGAYLIAAGEGLQVSTHEAVRPLCAAMRIAARHKD